MQRCIDVPISPCYDVANTPPPPAVVYNIVDHVGALSGAVLEFSGQLMKYVWIGEIEGVGQALRSFLLLSTLAIGLKVSDRHYESMQRSLRCQSLALCIAHIALLVRGMNR